MQFTTTVTQKGQATIPAPIRKKLGLKTGQKVAFLERGEKVVIEAVPYFLDLMGSLKTKKKFDPKAWDKAIGKYFAKRHHEKLEREKR